MDKTGNRQDLKVVSDGRSMQCSTSFERPKPVTPIEFAERVSPLLTLVAPSGMTQDERKAWTHAAFLALGDLYPDELRRAVIEAMKTADHPSKVVPAIRKALAAEKETGYKSMATIDVGIALPAPAQIEPDDPEREAMRQDMAKLVDRLTARFSA